MKTGKGRRPSGIVKNRRTSKPQPTRRRIMIFPGQLSIRMTRDGIGISSGCPIFPSLQIQEFEHSSIRRGTGQKRG